MSAASESAVERTTLDWRANLIWHVEYGPDIGPDTVVAERANYGQVVLEHRLRDALARQNPSHPTEALEWVPQAHAP